eukprot:CAMPEP_0177790776 /NCGR_PEP_ID=MMETSP0491_2-20121128/23545_1 /TAXON_ID=63592 /ORGANISM="Tetraselmis chuii, Strain PLY429" /LENGTH=77 /DNA_ID=CAMNT_0019312893 /DNA_START=670 /DNA_END=904 /DNA_ORIENTATION=+
MSAKAEFSSRSSLLAPTSRCRMVRSPPRLAAVAVAVAAALAFRGRGEEDAAPSAGRPEEEATTKAAEGTGMAGNETA